MRSLWFPLTVLLIVGLWVYTRFGPPPRADDELAMPVKVTAAEERELYLVPGGAYSAADIEANSGQTASEAYPNFRASHDVNPPPGSMICPITQTKADPRCSWIINGQRYLFCCPPCIDEFVRLAKTEPARIRHPDQYIKPAR